MIIDRKEIADFLNFIDRHDPLFTYTILDTDTKVALVGTGFGTAEELSDHILSVDKPGATLHITLNRTKTTGRKTGDIESARVLCVDLDRDTPVEELKQLIQQYKVQMVVRSSPDHYHLYWRLFPSVSLAEWKDLQAGLAYALKGDSNLSQITKTIRVPGVERLTKQGEQFMPCIVYREESPEELTPISIKEAFPLMEEWISKAQELAVAERKSLSKALKDWEAGKKSKHTVLSSSRNVTLFHSLVWKAVKAHGPDKEGLMHEASKLNASFPEPLTESEVRSVLDSALRTADVIKERNKEKLEEARSRVSQVLATPAKVSTAEVIEDTMDSNKTANPVLNGSGLSSEASLNGAAHSAEVLNSLPPAPAGLPASMDSYKYDYSSGVLSRNRFCDAAVVERVLQKFDKHVVRVGKDLYLFDPVEKVWRRNAHELLDLFVQSVCRDVLQDDRFIDELCKTADGNFSASKLKQWESHFTGNNFQLGCASKLKVSPAFRRMAITDFDHEEHLLYVENGVLNMRTGELRGASAHDYLLRRSSVTYRPHATCPGWEQFLKEVLEDTSLPDEEREGDTAEMVSFMQELFGYSLCGSISEQKLFIHYGSGSNGKSKVLECLSRLTGDYCTRIGGSTLSKSKQAVVKDFERLGAKIEGKRVVLLDDLDTATQWNEGIIKGLTSQTVTSRRLYEEENDIPNHAKIHIGCNEAPKPEAENFGILRRLCIIPYMMQFTPRADKEAEINKMMLDEASGILNWALQGYQRMHSRGGIAYPNKITVAVEEYKEQNFETESGLELLFSKPGSEAEGSWETLPELLKDVEHQFKVKNIYKTVSLESLGRFLSTKLKCRSDRRRVKRTGPGTGPNDPKIGELNGGIKRTGPDEQCFTRTRVYLVKLNYVRQYSII